MKRGTHLHSSTTEQSGKFWAANENGAETSSGRERPQGAEAQMHAYPTCPRLFRSNFYQRMTAELPPHPRDWLFAAVHACHKPFEDSSCECRAVLSVLDHRRNLSGHHCSSSGYGSIIFPEIGGRRPSLNFLPGLHSAREGTRLCGSTPPKSSGCF